MSEPIIVYDEPCDAVECCDVDSVILKAHHAAAFNEFTRSAKALHEVTQQAQRDIAAAQQRYREALARFTQLSVSPEG